jgi:hypothetical protein
LKKKRDSSPSMRLSLKAEEWVEVRSWEEIQVAMDEHGCLENLPFMPKMLQYCGQRFRVFKCRRGGPKKPKAGT